jgi:hypothetical protein
MRRLSGALAFMAGVALIIGSTGATSGQEEDPPPEESVMSEASPAAELAELSTLEIIDIAAAKTAGQPLKGKELKRALAKAAPAAGRYVINGLGDDAVGRIIGLSLAARAADEAGEPKTAAALLDVARLLYRNEWTRTKSDPVSLNAQIEEAIATGGYPELDPALVLASFAEPGRGFENLMDICVEGDVEFILNPAGPSECTDGGGRQVRADIAFVDPEKNGTDGLFTGDLATADVGGVGIHKVVQSKTANDKLTGKKYKKAFADQLKKSGAAIAGYEPGGRGAVEMVLAARAADEAGNQQAAKAFMDLALVAYRAGVPERDATGDYNASIVELINEEYAEVPGLELWPPEGMIDVCYTKKGDYVTCVDQASPWECWDAGGSKLERMSLEEAPCG